MTLCTGARFYTDSPLQSFSSLLSSIGGQPQAPQRPSTNAQRPDQPRQDNGKPNNLSNGTKLVPNNGAAGVKRKSEEPEPGPKPKAAKTEQNGLVSRPVAQPPTSRFQLSAKPGTTPKPSEVRQRLISRPDTPSNPQKSVPKPVPKPTVGTTPTPPSTANGAPPARRGFASIMEKAKAAQEAAKAAGPSGIKHKPVEKMTKRERLRLAEEAKAQQKAGKAGKVVQTDRSRSGTPVVGKPGLHKKPQETGYKGTMKKAAESLRYKGTMRAEGIGAAEEKEKKKGQAQDKYGGYASWSDLDDAEDEEEGYGSDGSSDMEGGYDDLAQEESLALRAAKKEDQAALEEEERHKREKSERKRRLQELSKSAASRKKY